MNQIVAVNGISDTSEIISELHRVSNAEKFLSVAPKPRPLFIGRSGGSKAVVWIWLGKRPKYGAIAPCVLFETWDTTRALDAARLTVLCDEWYVFERLDPDAEKIAQAMGIRALSILGHTRAGNTQVTEAMHQHEDRLWALSKQIEAADQTLKARHGEIEAAGAVLEEINRQIEAAIRRLPGVAPLLTTVSEVPASSPANVWGGTTIVDAQWDVEKAVSDTTVTRSAHPTNERPSEAPEIKLGVLFSGWMEMACKISGNVITPLIRAQSGEDGEIKVLGIRKRDTGGIDIICFSPDLTRILPGSLTIDDLEDFHDPIDPIIAEELPEIRKTSFRLCRDAWIGTIPDTGSRPTPSMSTSLMPPKTDKPAETLIKPKTIPPKQLRLDIAIDTRLGGETFLSILHKLQADFASKRLFKSVPCFRCINGGIGDIGFVNKKWIARTALFRKKDHMIIDDNPSDEMIRRFAKDHAFQIIDPNDLAEETGDVLRKFLAGIGFIVPSSEKTTTPAVETLKRNEPPKYPTSGWSPEIWKYLESYVQYAKDNAPKGITPLLDAKRPDIPHIGILKEGARVTICAIGRLRGNLLDIGERGIKSMIEQHDFFQHVTL